MARLFTYVVANDAGFAPNPFHGFCTLAVCKPKIRQTANIGDWIIGTGSGAKGKRRGGFIVFAMRVTEVMTFDQYWNDPRFRDKRPNLDAGIPLEHAFGDCFYFRCVEDPTEWCKIPAGHCKDSFLKQDTAVNRVLISDDFAYWGGDGPALPEFRGCDVRTPGRGHRCKFSDAVVEKVVAWIRGFQGSGDTGRCGEPLDMTERERALFRKQNGLTG